MAVQLRIIAFSILISSCTSQKIDRVYFNSDRSSVAAEMLESNENDIQTYREGSAGGKKGKKGGGCGCN